VKVLWNGSNLQCFHTRSHSSSQLFNAAGTYQRLVRSAQRIVCGTIRLQLVFRKIINYLRHLYASRQTAASKVRRPFWGKCPQHTALNCMRWYLAAFNFDASTTGILIKNLTIACYGQHYSMTTTDAICYNL
jgi:hypothetical protein